jgi:hypothetical protein
MKHLKVILYSATLWLVITSCTNYGKKNQRFVFTNPEDTSSRILERYKYFIDTPVCTDDAVSGCYKGVEFVDQEYAEKLHLTGTDIAHNYSNMISRYVGDHLKKLYREGKYSKVDLKRIQMTTRGMGDGDRYVEYYIRIPIVKTSKKKAMTGFDHSGGWGHTPDLRQRKKDLLKGSIVKWKKLNISSLYKTPEGLEEYWIQWQHTSLQ